MNRFLTLLIISCSSLWAQAKPCSWVYLQSAKAIKLKSGSRIFKLENGDFYKEESPRNSPFELAFNDDRASVLASQFLNAFGVGKYIAKTEHLENGMDLIVEGKKIQTKRGILQEGRQDIETPLEGHKAIYGVPPTYSHQVNSVLSQGDWPRHYANWKIIWVLLRQIDLNIENLGVSKGNVFIFDLGDTFNKNATRCQFGVCNELQNFDFIFPNSPSDRTQHVPDLRKADNEIKAFVKSLANSSVEDLKKMVGPAFDHHLRAPRGNTEEVLSSIRDSAKQLMPLLDRPPF